MVVNTAQVKLPNAYLRILEYNEAGVLIGDDIQHISTLSQNNWSNQLSLAYTAKGNGRIEVFVANESDKDVWFDDLSLTYEQNMIVQENHYYAFGMNMAGVGKVGKPDNKFQYNGKELVDDFDLNYNDFGARNYDSQLAQWHTIDPLAGKYQHLSPYNYCLNNPIMLVDPDGREAKPANNVAPPYVRLLFHGGAKNSSHNNTFESAAINISNEYKAQGETVKSFRISAGGQSIVNTINSQGENSVQSIDFFTHGGSEALYFKPDANKEFQELYMNNNEEQKDVGNTTSSDKNVNGADIGEIDYSVFTNNAKIEIHGCNSGDIDKGANLASTMSKHLTNAGKSKAVVIAHGTQANPDGHTKLKGDDYRHGLRRVYHGGKVLFTTRKEGRITATNINKFLKLKKEQGENYNGTKQKL